MNERNLKGGNSVTSLPEPLAVLKEQLLANKAKVPGRVTLFAKVISAEYGPVLSKASENKMLPNPQILCPCSVYSFLLVRK